MQTPKPRTAIRIFVLGLALLACACMAAAQNAPARPGTLRGVVTDPSGASVPNAAIKLTSPADVVLTRGSDANGAFEFADLVPGNYSLEITATGFAPREQALQVTGAQVQQLTVALEVATQQQEVTVNEVAPTVDTSPSANAGAVAMSGSDLDALSDDPDQLAADLQALAGSSSGPTGGAAQIFIDGFSGGTLPPKSSIREIRINQNPFAAEFDQMGFGRVEILTKPGTDQLHGRVGVTGNSSAFNTKSPYVAAGNQVAYHSILYDGNISGSIHRVASFAVTGFRRNIDDSAIVNAIVLDPSFNPVPFTAGVGAPQKRTMLFPRFDYQVNRDNTLTTSYQYARGVLENLGVGGFALPSQASTSVSTAHQLQVINSRVIGERAVNETRFQYIHNSTEQIPLTPATAIRVTGAFTGGGSPGGTVTTTTGNYELQNNTSIISGPHIFKFGGRLRAGRLSNSSTNNFNGTYTFTSLTAYQLTLQGQAQGLSAAQIRANGGGASQFSITAGTPRTTATVVDGGLYLQDDWKLRPNITLSGGLRFETQNGVPDHSDIAPRVGLAWSIGQKARPWVMRTGFGIFYQRFPINNELALNRYDGITQQQYFVTNPDFYPTIPATSGLTGSLTSPTVYSLTPDYHSSYFLQWAATVEKQLNRVTNLSINYFGGRGVHRTIQSNVNAPLPGSITAANPAGIRPIPAQGNIYEYISASDYILT